ncbi:MAG: hypothetical protein JXQ90_22480 [Cyclobacteriaceae bacterium]
MKNFFIGIQLVALFFLVLDLFEVYSFPGVKAYGYGIILIGLLITLMLKRKSKI